MLEGEVKMDSSNRYGVLIAAWVLSAGCVTSGRGDRMQGDIDKLRERVDAMDRRDVDINEQVARLRKVLDQATALLSRNSADVGAKVAKSEADIATLTGQLEEAKHLLGQLQKTVNDGST